MLKNLFTSLPSNLINNFNYLKQDYTGFNFDPTFLSNALMGLIISVGLILISFLIGEKICKLFFNSLTNKHTDIAPLIYIALGYIAISSGIAILGFFSLLYPTFITIYITSVFIISIYPLRNLKNKLKSFIDYLKDIINYSKVNKFVFTFVILFISLAIINLINPEIREDQYHVDLPKIYLNNKTIMIPPKEEIRVSASPMLSEMSYLVGIFIWSKESARYIHFMFYLLIIITLFEFSKIQGYKFSLYTPLLFTTTPVVVHEASSMYTDFQWIFLFLISILILIKNKQYNNRLIILSGFILGGMLAAKLWTIVFIPVMAIFLFVITKKRVTEKIKYVSLFLIATLCAPFLWLLRAYALTGNLVYPAFIHETTLENIKWNLSISHLIVINYPLFNPLYFINIVSPIFFIGCVFFVYKLRDNAKLIKIIPIFRLTLLLFITYMFINYPFGRYLLGLYVVVIFFSSIGISRIYENLKSMKLLLNILLLLVFLYYMASSLLVLPYAVGFNDKNNYLTRTFLNSNLGYFDFGRKFDKYILKNDLVGMYNVGSYYYVNFNYIDTNYIFDKNHRSFSQLKKSGVTKLFIRNGDIAWFCKRINLSHCDFSEYYLISSYSAFPTFYLYEIR